MAKQKVTIEADIPDGYEATGEFRPTIYGEPWLGPDRCVAFHSCPTPSLILRKKWTPPASAAVGLWFFPCGDFWYATFEQPHKVGGNWPIVSINAKAFTDFTPPPERRPYKVGEP